MKRTVIRENADQRSSRRPGVVKDLSKGTERSANAEDQREAAKNKERAAKQRGAIPPAPIPDRR